MGKRSPRTGRVVNVEDGKQGFQRGTHGKTPPQPHPGKTVPRRKILSPQAAREMVLVTYNDVVSTVNYDGRMSVGYEYHCLEEGCYEGDDYCRCGTVDESTVGVPATQVTKRYLGELRDAGVYELEDDTELDVDAERLAQKIVSTFGGDPFQDRHNWDVVSSWGYYGQEIDSVSFRRWKECGPVLKKTMIGFLQGRRT